MSTESFFRFVQPLLKDHQSQSSFRLLGDWPRLANRYSVVDDEFKNLRAIQRWCQNDQRFNFVTLDTDSKLENDEILQLIRVRSTPFHFFAEGDFKSRVNVRQLKKLLVCSGNGLEGILDHDGNRFFVGYAPAISTAKRSSGSAFKNIEEVWGVQWRELNNSRVVEIKELIWSVTSRFFLFVKRRYRVIAAIRSFDQLKYLLGRRLIAYKNKILMKKTS